LIGEPEAPADVALAPGFSAFAIGFDHRDRARLHELWDGVLDSERWTEGELVERFERGWAAHNRLEAVATGSWAGAAAAALRFAAVSDQVVLCPSNTFMATPLSVLQAGGRVEFVDCSREDLCMSFRDFEQKAERHRPRAAWLVHIGGHVAFDSEDIAAYCREHGIFLIEDCAHAHGASWNGRRPGSWGDAGIYSLYATKTISSGEGGVLVTRHAELAEYARRFRNYGKPDYDVEGTNARMSEFTAAIGLVALDRLDEIVAWKNGVAERELDPIHPGRLLLPEGMVSGLYKYIVFDPLSESSGKVYDQPCHRIMGHATELPDSDWIASNHWCVPLYYRGGRGQEGTS
jgi:perosamine synthetase